MPRCQSCEVSWQFDKRCWVCGEVGEMGYYASLMVTPNSLALDIDELLRETA